MKKVTIYAFPLVWLIVGSNYLWRLLTGGFDLLRPLNIVLLILASIGTLGSLPRVPALHLAAGIAGVLLSIIDTYFVWLLGGFGASGGWTFSYNWWAWSISGSATTSFAVVQNITLVTFSCIAAYVAADTLDRKKVPIQLLRPTGQDKSE